MEQVKPLSGTLPANIGYLILQISNLQDENNNLKKKLRDLYLLLAKHKGDIEPEELDLLRSDPNFKEYMEEQ